MIELDIARHKVTASGRDIRVTPTEFKILKLLAQSDGKVISRPFMLKTVWGIEDDMAIQSRTVDQHVARLRGRLGKDGAAISTVCGQGYKAHGIEIVSAERPRAKVLGFDKRTNQARIKMLHGGEVTKGQTVTLS